MDIANVGGQPVLVNINFKWKVLQHTMVVFYVAVELLSHAGGIINALVLHFKVVGDMKATISETLHI